MGLRHRLYLDWVYRALGRLSILGGQAFSLGDRLLDVGAIQALRWLGQNASRACGWIDGCVLTPAFHPIDRAAAPLAWAVGWLDRRMAPALGVLVHLGRYPARVAGLFDRWLDGGLMVVKPAVMGLVSLSAVVERGLSRAVDAVGGAVRASRPWLQPRTGRVQSYLRLAFASLVVLMAVLSVFLLI